MSAGDAANRVKQQVQDGVAKAQREFENAKAQAKRINERSQLPPAEDADQALQQVRDLRARLDRDLAALQSRVPPRESMMGQAKAVGGAVVGGLALVGTLATLRQKRQEKKQEEAEADKTARAIARHLPAAFAEFSPPVRPVATGDGADTSGGGVGRTLAMIALLAAAAFAVWKQRQPNGDDEDIWGPPAASPTMPPGAPEAGMPPGVPPTPPTAPGVPSTAPTSNEEDLFGNRPPAP